MNININTFLLYYYNLYYKIHFFLLVGIKYNLNSSQFSPFKWNFQICTSLCLGEKKAQALEQKEP